MAEDIKRPLKVFLCHASGDKPAVRDLYKRLVAEGVDAWLDQEKLMPGQDWQLEIPRAVREADVVVVCLSNKSITKEGYIQKEIKFALDKAEEKLEDTIFLIPARLEPCVVPERLERWQWVDLFDENGFVRLLRSLKLRADGVGATIQPVEYENEDEETDGRLDQLYTEGLAAFYTEDWDRACHRFQTILRERPNHKDAAEKLAQAELQRNLAKHYSQATEAYKSENWRVVIQALEELLEKSKDYKDAIQLLADAKKRNQLKELYAEAKRLHDAQKWQAVVKVFEQISIIEPTYPDADNLLTSAQKELAELQRIEQLNKLYSQGVREMDAGRWYEARRLLEQVHKAQIGFLETEHLLRKSDDEITKIEQLEKRNIQINTLYEQAHGLVRSQNWREALRKIEEIQQLDPQFEDKDEIAKSARAALNLEEQEIQKQNQLAAMYAEAVRLLKEENYQEALDKWQAVRVIDSKYPDRQWVQRTAKRKLAESGKPLQIKPRFVITKPFSIGIVSFVVLAVAAIAGVILSNTGSQKILSTPTRNVPHKTNTPRPSTPVLTVSGYAGSTFYEGFDDPVWDGKINPSLWSERQDCSSVSQQNGSMVFKNSNQGCDLIVTQPRMVSGEKLGALEAKLMIDNDHQGGIVTQEIDFITSGLPGGAWWSDCVLFADHGDVSIFFEVVNVGEQKPPELHKSIPAKYNQWYVLRMEVDPQTMTFSCQVDGKTIGSVIPKDAETLRNAQFERLTEGARYPGASATSYVDYIQILP